MRVLLLGWPLAHSLSPRFQNAAFRAASLPHEYQLMPVQVFEPERVRALLRASDVLGANVTVPHKQSILACVDELTPGALAVGAANTVFRGGEGEGEPWLIGDNTDVAGFLADLRGGGVGVEGCTAVVLGAGGAARAVAVALASRVEELVVVNRTATRAETLLDALGVAGRALAWPAEGAHTALREVMERAELVVDTTSLGLGLRPGEIAWEAAVRSLDRLGLGATRPRAFFYDLKYGHATPFLAAAGALGRPHRDGLGMLVAQGALSFERWTGCDAPLEVMAAAVGLTATPVLHSRAG